MPPLVPPSRDRGGFLLPETQNRPPEAQEARFGRIDLLAPELVCFSRTWLPLEQE